MQLLQKLVAYLKGPTPNCNPCKDIFLRKPLCSRYPRRGRTAVLMPSGGSPYGLASRLIASLPLPKLKAAVISHPGLPPDSNFLFESAQLVMKQQFTTAWTDVYSSDPAYTSLAGFHWFANRPEYTLEAEYAVFKRRDGTPPGAIIDALGNIDNRVIRLQNITGPAFTATDIVLVSFGLITSTHDLVILSKPSFMLDDVFGDFPRMSAAMGRPFTKEELDAHVLRVQNG